MEERLAQKPLSTECSGRNVAGLYFALRSREEHCNLWFSSIQQIEKEGCTLSISFVHGIRSKTNPGSLKHRKVQVIHHANVENPDFFLYKQYRSHRPENVEDDLLPVIILKERCGTEAHR